MDTDETQPELPEALTLELGELVSLAEKSLGSTLSSMVLFGSAAEGRLRANSDVNLLVVLSEWNPQRWDGLRDTPAQRPCGHRGVPDVRAGT